jgi:hypothetical protein
VRLTDSLNATQLTVLRWIVDGCPDGVMSGNAYKLTARALQSRRLVDVVKGKNSWSATATDLGRFYAEHGHFPATVERPRPEPKRQPQPASTPSPRKSDVPAGSDSAVKQRPAKKAGAAERLVDQVLAAGGLLKLPDEAAYDSCRFHDLTRIANRHGKTPPGKRLVYQLADDGDWRSSRHHLFVLEDGLAGTDSPLQPVPVPETIGRYHKAVSSLNKAKRIEVAPAARGRALRIMHALAVEAERRGFTAKSHQPEVGHDHGRSSTAWHLLLTTNDETVPLRISEETDRVEHLPTAREKKDQERHYWMRIPSHENVASGRLRIDLGGAVTSERRSFWADRASWTLEEKLPELLREVAVRADELRLRRKAKERAETIYQQDLAREQEHARARADEAHRLKTLQQQLDRWREVSELRAFAADLAEHLTTDTGQDEAAIADARRWLAWTTDRADRRNPFRTLPTWPEPPRLHSYEVSQFMNRVPEPAELRYKPGTY